MKRNFSAHKVRVKNRKTGFPTAIELEGYTIGRDGKINWKNPVTVTLHCHDYVIREINQKFVETQYKEITRLKDRIQRLRESI